MEFCSISVVSFLFLREKPIFMHTFNESSHFYMHILYYFSMWLLIKDKIFDHLLIDAKPMANEPPKQRELTVLDAPEAMRLLTMVFEWAFDDNKFIDNVVSFDVLAASSAAHFLLYDNILALSLPQQWTRNHLN